MRCLPCFGVTISPLFALGAVTALTATSPHRAGHSMPRSLHLGKTGEKQRCAVDGGRSVSGLLRREWGELENRHPIPKARFTIHRFLHGLRGLQSSHRKWSCGGKQCSALAGKPLVHRHQPSFNPTFGCSASWMTSVDPKRPFAGCVAVRRFVAPFFARLL